MAIHATMSEPIRKDPNLSLATQQASSILNELMGDSDIEVQADWELHDFGGKDLVRLTLGNGTERASSAFRATELNERDYMLRRLNRLLGEHLQKRLHTVVQSLPYETVAHGADK